MEYSLKRKTPLKRSGFKPRQTHKGEPKALLPTKDGKNRTEARKTPSKAKISTRSSLETHLDIVFSLYIRLRDAMDGGMTQCISCGRVFPFSNMQCGHYISRANLFLRWDERNANAECIHCNCFDSNHLVGYRKNLIKKIGESEVVDIERSRYFIKKFSKEELRNKIDYFRKQIIIIAREKGISVRI